MATEHATETLTTIDRERLRLAIVAACGVCSIAGPLQDMTGGQGDAEMDAAHQLAIRLEQLAGAILSVLDDSKADLDECRLAVYGPEHIRWLKRQERSA